MLHKLKSEFKYDAFISHSHKDKKAIRALATFLSNYRVPLRRRRKLFLDHSALAAGELTEQILNAIEDSNFLIVCTSENAIHSEWVKKEITAFKNIHGVARILAVRVGSAEDNKVLTGLPQGLFIPDLRGLEDHSNFKSNAVFKENALSLLAPLLGYDDKNSLTDAVALRTKRIAYSSVFLALSVLIGYSTWKYWLSTLTGLRYTTVQEVLIMAETETYDTPYIISAAPAIARSGPEAIVQFSRFYKSDVFKPVALATGYAYLDPPDCAKSEEQFLLVDADTISTAREEWLLVAMQCPNISLNLLQPKDQQNVTGAKWATQLATAGFHKEAWGLTKNLSGKQRMDVFVALESGGYEVPHAAINKTIIEWQVELSNNGEDGLWELTEYLESFELSNAMNSKLSDVFLDIANNSFIRFDDEQTGLVNSWSKMQQIAAHLALSGRTDDGKRHANYIYSTALT